MTTGNDIAFQSASELRDLIRGKQVSPVELVRLYFERIDRLNPQLNAYLTLVQDQAQEAAQAAEDAVMRGDDLGPLHGVPIGVKDLESTAGIRTTGGSLVFEDRVPTADSTVVERVRASGAIILGKTNTPELGLLGSTESRLGDCRNPWDTSRSTGGSSGGAGAALAAGLCALATGGDGGGSIRIPASFCGVYGIKPTQGRVPKFGGVAGPPMANQFSQQGPMSRTVKDSAVLLQVVAGHDPRDPGSLREAPEDYVAATERGVEGLRIGWSLDLGYAPAEAEVAEYVGHRRRGVRRAGLHRGGRGLCHRVPLRHVLGPVHGQPVRGLWRSAARPPGRDHVVHEAVPGKRRDGNGRPVLLRAGPDGRAQVALRHALRDVRPRCLRRRCRPRPSPWGSRRRRSTAATHTARSRFPPSPTRST